MTRVAFLLAFIVAAEFVDDAVFVEALTPKDPPYGQLAVKGTNLVGEDGSPVQLIGMSLFWSQWMGQYFNRDTVNALACQWGSNVVRAAMGVDEGGTGYLHDKSELTKVRTVVEAAIERGIYVIIDWHDHNAHQHKADAIAFFQQMATDYGQYPHVLYETFNEPLQISWQNDLKPYHTDVVNAIRKIDAKNVALLGTPAWSGESGITDASNSPLTGLTNVMYVQHFYSGSHRDSARSAYSNAAAKIPVFISEYGISNADGGSDGQIFPDETNKWFQLLDGNKASYLAWSIADKNEASSALKPGTSPAQVGDDVQLSGSGTFLKKWILAKRLFSCDGALPPASPSPAPAPVPAPAPDPVPSPPSSGGGAVSVSVTSSQKWNGGGVADITVTNNGDAPVCGVTLQLSSGSIRAGEFWNILSSDQKTFTNQYSMYLNKGQTYGAGGTYDGNEPTFNVAATKAC